jgi:DNA polymerase
MAEDEGEGATRNRVRLWLRSERAFGLNFVPVPLQRHGAIVQSNVAANSPPPQVADDDDERRTATTITPPRFGQPSATRSQSSSSLSSLNAAVEPPRNTAPIKPLVPMPSAQPFDAPTLPREDKARRLTALDNNEVRDCTKCRLCETRSNTVFGEGDVDAKVFFIGEGPGENEDLQGRPFVGKAGEMLNKWIAAMGFRREDVYIANIVKCRPPGNRVPMPDEVATCTPYLERQLEIIRPKVIVTLGLPALKYMANDPKLTMGRSRGTWREWRGIRWMPTFHPAYVLRQYTEETRSAVWSDLQRVMKELGMSPPERAK